MHTHARERRSIFSNRPTRDVITAGSRWYVLEAGEVLDWLGNTAPVAPAGGPLAS
ncbi:MAG: hypothetical protein ACR2LX_12780 [Jatrophihabitans sp.]